MPVDMAPALTLAAFGFVFLALVGITLAVALMDIRRELRSLQRAVRRTAFVRCSDAGDTAGIDRCPRHPSQKEKHQ